MIESKTETALGSLEDADTRPEAVKPPARVSQKHRKPTRAIKKTDQKPASPKARRGTKTAKILQLLRRPEGASLAELGKATKWQPHSVRGFLSATVKGKMRLKLSSSKREDSERAYRVPAK